MSLPVRHRPRGLIERAYPWRQPMAAEFDELFERMNRFLESASAFPSAETGPWAPLADMRETDETYTIECELPGFERDDIDIEISDRELVISGQMKEKEEEREGVLRHGTRRTGHFEYRTMLPSDVKSESCQASLANGVLKVTIPKTEASKPRHVEIRD